MRQPRIVTAEAPPDTSCNPKLSEFPHAHCPAEEPRPPGLHVENPPAAGIAQRHAIAPRPPSFAQART